MKTKRTFFASRSDGGFDPLVHDVGHWESLKRWTNPPKETVMVVR